MILSDLKINPEWTLFLDRDGVINKRIPGDYVRTWDQFEFLPGVFDSLKSLAGSFGHILIVSNQQGIGKGLMSEADLKAVHDKMIGTILQHGGRIDKAYHSPFREEEGSIRRKPNVGMALQARKDFPGIRFRKSVMVGDSISDMVFGRRLGMQTVFLCDDVDIVRKGHAIIDFAFPDLITFTRNVVKTI
jgi:D-glycero-D-manno-heptose 1,7-bisphosphate phosphatase